MSAIGLLVLLGLAHQPGERPASSPAATQGSLFVGQVLGRDVYVQALPDDRAARIKELHRLLSKPLFERYHEANRERLDPTESEVDDYISFMEEHKKKDQQERAARRAELERRLADSKLIPEARPELEKELDVLKQLEARINEPSTLTPEMKRDAERQFAKWWLSRWKLNVALYHDYGGGRVLWQQSGTEAWDATRRFYEAHERDGLLKIPDAKLRADFYHYWTADQGPFLSDRVHELLNPPWLRQSATQPDTQPAKRAVTSSAHAPGRGDLKRVEYKYKSGALKLVEEVQGESIVRSTWYLPDGTMFRSTLWEDGKGTGYYLDDDGKVRLEIPYVDGLAHGIGFEFKRDGNSIHVTEVVYERGKRKDP